MANPINSYLSALAALVVVLGLVLLAARAARTTGLVPRQERGTKRLVVRESLTLDRLRRLQIVHCDGRDLLLLTGGGHDVVVGWLAPKPHASEPQA